LKNENSAWCATFPRRRASTSASIDRGETTRSKSHIDEQSPKRSRSVTEKLVFRRSSSRTIGLVSRVGRWNAESARSRRRSQPFDPAMARAGLGSAAASDATARTRSRSFGAASSCHVSAESARRFVQRSTSSGGNSVRASSQNGLGSRAAPSSVAASRTRYSRRVGRVHAV
jgi:hypothetical protein